MPRSAKNPSLLTKILVGIFLAAFFLLFQLVGVFYSNRISANSLAKITDLQRSVEKAEDVKTLISESMRIINQLPIKAGPFDRENIRASKQVELSTQARANDVLSSLNTDSALEEDLTSAYERAKNALGNYSLKAIEFYEKAEAATVDKEELAALKLIVSQYESEAQEALTKLKFLKSKEARALTSLLHDKRFQPAKISLALTTLFLMVVLTGGLVFWKSFSRSISNLLEATTEVSGGNLEYTASITSMDELGRLTKEFNKMAKNLLETTVSKEYVNSIIDSFPDPLFLAGENGKITRANSMASRTLGMKEEEILGRNIGEFFKKGFHPGAKEEFLRTKTKTFEAVLETKNAENSENVESLKNNEVPVYCSVAAAWKNNNEVETFIYAVKNISQLRKLQQELKHKNADLVATNKELEAFSYSVSHDLRAPLRSIDGFSSNLLEKYRPQLDGQAQDYLDRIRASTQKMGQLIDDLLNLSRLGRTELVKKEVNLSKIVQSIADNLKAQEENRKVDFIIQKNVIAYVDPKLIEVVLQNLINNSWKFTSKHARAEIEFGCEYKDGEKVFYVKDDGAGFDMNYVQKLFTPFQRLHGVSEFEGTGIGLAIVNRVIHRHGGRVWAEGEVEKGAKFQFTLKKPMREKAA